MTNFIRFLSATFLATLLGTSALYARDTDVYFVDGTSTSAGAVKPNILLSLDTSGSMNQQVGTTTTTRVDAMKDAMISLLDSMNENTKVGLARYSNNYGGPIVYPAKALNDSVTITGNIQVVTQNGLDDAHELVSSTAVTTNSATLFLGSTGADAGTTVRTGLRFRRLYIPQGVTITSAFIRFKARNTDSNALDLRVSADLNIDAPAYSATNANISARTQTTAFINWTGAANWTSTTQPNNVYSTPDLSTVVQEVVGQGNWCYGNAIAFQFQRTAGTGRRRAVGYEDYGNNPTVAELVVTYNPGSVPSSSNCNKAVSRVTGSSDDAKEKSANGNMTLNGGLNMAGTSAEYVGVRFQSVNVPPGATIVSAYLDFTASSADSSATSLTIKGHKTINSTTFTSSNDNISSRYSSAATTASTSWSSIPSTTVGSTLTTPDLRLVVQELIDQGSWASGNPMTFLLYGNSGVRNVYSYDTAAASAPALRIVYTTNTPWQKTVRDVLREEIVGIITDANTPTADALYEAARYFRGEGVTYGNLRASTGSNDEERRISRVSHPSSYTPANSVSTPTGCTGADPNNFNCAAEQITGTAIYVSPIEYSCQANHIVMLTDGAPTANNSAALIRTMAGITSCVTNEGANHACVRDLAKFLANEDQSSLTNIAGIKQVVKVHAIGLNVDAGTTTFLQSVATNGGGQYHSATDTVTLLAAFNTIFNDVLSAPTSFVSPSLSVNAFNRLFNRDEVYFTLFSPDLTFAWPGNIKKFTLCATGSCNFGEVIDVNGIAAIDSANAKIKTTARSYWSTSTDGPNVQVGGAGEQIPSHSTRRVYTYTGSSDAPTVAVDITATAHQVTNANTALTQAMLGAADATERTTLINWMRGQDNADEDSDSNTTENRWSHADALHSRPVTITYGGTATSPVIKLVVGTNEGALRMIDAATGQEDWVIYLPEFLSMQKDLRNNPNGTHKIGVDGAPTVQVIDINNDGIIDPDVGDKVRVFIGMRRGGRDIYAFDLTPEPGSPLTTSSAIGAIKPKYMWRIKGGTGNYTLLGQTWSKPLLAKVWVKCPTSTACPGTTDSMLKDVLIFAGGYDPNFDGNDTYALPTGSDSTGAAIYMVDPENGSREWWAAGTSSGADLVLSNMQYSIPSDLALLDSDGDRAVDRIYVGDTRGQLFRIDLGKQIDKTGSSATQRNGGSEGYLFASIGSTSTNQDRRAFFFPPDIAQIRDATYSTIETFDYVTIATGNREDPLDKSTKLLTQLPVYNRIYAFRDVNVKAGPPASTPSTITHTGSALFDATANVLANTSDTNYATALGSIQASKGWFIDLKSTASPYWIGEKSLAKTTIFAGVLYVTTYVPPQTSGSSTSCEPLEGTAYLFALDLLNGVGKLTGGARSEAVGGGIPSELVVVIRPGGTSALIGTSGGARQANVGGTLPRFKTYWKQE